MEYVSCVCVCVCTGIYMVLCNFTAIRYSSVKGYWPGDRDSTSGRVMDVSVVHHVHTPLCHPASFPM
jgi:hypothetical protein